MEEKKEMQQADQGKMEYVPVGVITMQLAEYSKANKRLVTTIICMVICWMLTVCGFLIYLSEYEVQVNNYGGLTDSKINAGTGQQADTMTNYFQKEDSK